MQQLHLSGYFYGQIEKNSFYESCRVFFVDTDLVHQQKYYKRSIVIVAVNIHYRGGKLNSLWISAQQIYF